MQIWKDFLELEKVRLGKHTVEKWLSPIKILRYDACNLYLEASDSLVSNWFEEHVRERVHKVLINNNGRRIKVHLTLKDSLEKEKGSSSSTQQKAFSQDSLNPYYTFEEFIPPEKGILPFSVLSKLGKKESDSYNPIFLFGEAGTGKTHLLMAIAHQFIATGLNIFFVRSETFTYHVVHAFRNGLIDEFRSKYRNIDVLIIDDIDHLAGKKATQEEFFHTFNTLHTQGKQIVLSSRFAIKDLEGMEPRLISRFEWGLTLPLAKVDKNELFSILLKRSQSLEFPLSEKSLQFLSDTFPNPSKLLKALEALILRLHLKKNPMQDYPSALLTEDQIKQEIADLIREEQKKKLTANTILENVSQYFGISAEELLGKSQKKEISFPRKMSLYLCRKHLKLPFLKLGKIFNRDHSTVMTSIDSIEKLYKQKDSRTHTALHKIEKSLL